MTVRSGLSEAQRLDLICDAIRYCQRVRDKGMPNSAWTKALREPIHFLWEKRGGNKLEAARYRSLASAGIPRGGGRIRYDHAVPFRALQAQLMEMAAPSTDAVKEVLVRDLTVCIITSEEEALLNAARLGSRMPPNWDGRDPLARYHTVGIEVEPNPAYVGGA